MKPILPALLFFLIIGMPFSLSAQDYSKTANLEFWGKKISFQFREPRHDLNFGDSHLIQESFFNELNSISATAVEQINSIKQEMGLTDWLTYQLIRKCANAIIPKTTNFNAYTLIKAVILQNLGYSPLVGWDGSSYLLYIMSNDELYNLPLKIHMGKSYVCINYHDFNYSESIHFSELKLKCFNVEQGKAFRFSISNLPAITPALVTEKKLEYQYKSKSYNISVLVNQEMRNYFTHYPVMKYESQFNIPVNEITRHSLLNNFRFKLKDLPVKEGVSLLMNFTRTAFDFANDTEVFGREKRLSPEETLLYEKSDCEDRAALFFFLVKEIYNLPMIVLSYADHVNVGVLLDGKGYTVNHQDKVFTVCEPTPQKKNRSIGKLDPARKKDYYEIAYVYNPDFSGNQE